MIRLLEAGMLFMIHPNQHLPETGYLLCGEPVLLTAHGAEPLTQRAVRARRDRCFRIGERPVLAMQSDAAGGAVRLGSRADAEGRVPRARQPRFGGSHPAAAGAIVYGDRAHHAELAYLTGFTPKLEAALALIPRVGTPRLLVGGGVNMLQAAKPLTFIEDLQPLRNVGETVVQWAREQSGGGRPVLIGGPFMPYALRREIDKAIAQAASEDRGQDRPISAR